jgi:hypothetical protein
MGIPDVERKRPGLPRRQTLPRVHMQLSSDLVRVGFSRKLVNCVVYRKSANGSVRNTITNASWPVTIQKSSIELSLLTWSQCVQRRW